PKRPSSRTRANQIKPAPSSNRRDLQPDASGFAGRRLWCAGELWIGCRANLSAQSLESSSSRLPVGANKRLGLRREHEPGGRADLLRIATGRVLSYTTKR